MAHTDAEVGTVKENDLIVRTTKVRQFTKNEHFKVNHFQCKMFLKQVLIINSYFKLIFFPRGPDLFKDTG